MSSFFFFNDTATTEIYTLSLHDALPISANYSPVRVLLNLSIGETACPPASVMLRSEEHTSDLQSQSNLVCRLLLEKKKRDRLAELLEARRQRLICAGAQPGPAVPRSDHG